MTEALSTASAIVLRYLRIGPASSRRSTEDMFRTIMLSGISRDLEPTKSRRSSLADSCWIGAHETTQGLCCASRDHHVIRYVQPVVPNEVPGACILTRATTIR